MSRSWCAWMISSLLFLSHTSPAYKESHRTPIDFATGILDGKLEIPNDGGLVLGSGRFHHQPKTQLAKELRSPSFAGFLGKPISNLLPKEEGTVANPLSQFCSPGQFQFSPPEAAEISDAEWLEGCLHVLMKPGKASPTSFHLYRMKIKPNGEIGSPQLFALAPPGQILTRLAKVENRLFAVSRMAGEPQFRLLELRSLGTNSGGWVDFGPAPVVEHSLWDLASSGETLLILSPQSRQVAHSEIPRINEWAGWSKASLGGGPWVEAIESLLTGLQSNRDDSAVVYNEFLLPQAVVLDTLALETSDTEGPSFRYRIAKTEEEWFGDWSEPNQKSAVEIGSMGQVVQYQLIQPAQASPSKVTEVKLEWDLQDSDSDRRWHFTQSSSAHEKEEIEALFRKNWTSWPRLSASQSANVVKAGRQIGKVGSQKGSTPFVEGAHSLSPETTSAIPGQSDEPPSSGRVEGREQGGDLETLAKKNLEEALRQPVTEKGANAVPSSIHPPSPIASGEPESMNQFPLRARMEDESETSFVSPQHNPEFERGRDTQNTASPHSNMPEQREETVSTPQEGSTGTRMKGALGENRASPDGGGPGSGEESSNPPGGESPHERLSKSTAPPSLRESLGPDADSRGESPKALQSSQSPNSSALEPYSSKPGQDSGKGEAGAGPDRPSAGSVKPNRSLRDSSPIKVTEPATELDSSGVSMRPGDALDESATLPLYPPNPTEEPNDSGPTLSPSESAGKETLGARMTASRGIDPGRGSGGPLVGGLSDERIDRLVARIMPKPVTLSGENSNSSRKQEPPVRSQRDLQESPSIFGGLSEWVRESVVEHPSTLVWILWALLLLLTEAIHRLLKNRGWGGVSLPPFLQPSEVNLIDWEKAKHEETAAQNLLSARSVHEGNPRADLTPVAIELPNHPEPTAKIEWTVADPLPQPMASGAAFYRNGQVYVVDPHGTICSAKINADGSLKPWYVRMGHLPAKIGAGSVAVLDRRVVCQIGPKLYSAEVDERGIGIWDQSGVLDGLTGKTTLAGLGSRVYFIGGQGEQGKLPLVRSMEIDSDGKMRDLQNHSPLPLGVREAGCTIEGNRIYLVGGRSGNQVSALVFSAAFDSDGFPGTWRIEAEMPCAMRRPIVQAWKGNLWVIGGGGGQSTKAVVAAKIGREGIIQGWQRVNTNLPEPVTEGSATRAGGRFLIMGGRDARDYGKTFTEVYWLEPRLG